MLATVNIEKTDEHTSDDGAHTDEEEDAGPVLDREVSKRCRQCNIRVDCVSQGDQHLHAHKVPCQKDQEIKDTIVAGIRRNRFCNILEDKQVDAIVHALEYFKFQAGDTIVKQGDAGNYFFVVHEGICEVSINGSAANSLGPGVAFGAIALLYNCPRTATVTAQGSCGIWGASGNVFRQIVQEHARENRAENCQFLNSIRLFDGLSPKQKGRISERALFVERFEEGSCVVTEGELPAAMYFVRRGRLSAVQGGQRDASGALSGGSKVAQLCAGHCFGERAALYNEPHSASVIADGGCEIVCLGIMQLKEVLGDNLVSCLEQSFICSILRTLPVVSYLSSSHQQHLAQSMDVWDYKEGQLIEDGLRLIIVLEGEVRNSDPGDPVTLRRGQWWQDTDLLQLQVDSSAPTSSSSYFARFAAGENGARIAALTRDKLATALQSLGLCRLDAGEEKVIEYMRKILLAKKVPVFSQLSKEQVDNVASLLVLRRYARGAQVFRKGEPGSAFFVVAAGELSVLVDGGEVRVLRRGMYFGERALLFDEPRSATVQVRGDGAELWSLDQQSFRRVVTESMREELVHRIRLQATDFALRSLRPVRLIGAGSFGSVRLVRHRRSGQRYALKRVRKEDGRTPEAVSREWELLAEIDHPFVLRMVRTFETGSSVYIVMELVTGGQLCEEVHERMGLLSRKQAQFYIASLAVILEALHEMNIAYRDLKPENVMLDSHGYLKLVDFGLAKKLDKDLLRTFTLVGTPLYMAPEVVKGNGYGVEVDIWSLGVMMFEFVCGTVPFGVGCANEHEVLESVVHDELKFPSRYNDQAGKKLIQGLLSKSPATRLGVGINGWSDVKSAKFFKAGVSGDLFSMILGREAIPPVVPASEQYSDERVIGELALSDAEELGPAESELDRPLAIFRHFDRNGDGRISHRELARVLQRLEPATFTDAAVRQLLDAADANGDGHISFEEFLFWIESEDSEPLRLAVDADLPPAPAPAPAPA